MMSMNSTFGRVSRDDGSDAKECAQTLLDLAFGILPSQHVAPDIATIADCRKYLLMDHNYCSINTEKLISPEDKMHNLDLLLKCISSDFDSGYDGEHGDGDNTNFVCETCKKTFTKRCYLYKHKRRVHFLDTGSPSNVQTHIIDYGNSKTVQCSNCNVLIAELNMKSHLKTCLKSAQCQFCGIHMRRNDLVGHITKMHTWGYDRVGNRDVTVVCCACRRAIKEQFINLHFSEMHQAVSYISNSTLFCQLCKVEVPSSQMSLHLMYQHCSEVMLPSVQRRHNSGSSSTSSATLSASESSPDSLDSPKQTSTAGADMLLKHYLETSNPDNGSDMSFMPLSENFSAEDDVKSAVNMAEMNHEIMSSSILSSPRGSISNGRISDGRSEIACSSGVSYDLNSFPFSSELLDVGCNSSDQVGTTVAMSVSRPSDDTLLKLLNAVPIPAK